jgi:putative inorganic carbon (HCO3(-)) transporter
MHLLEDSLFYKGCRRSVSWLADAGRHSLVGRGLTGAAAEAGRIFASSFVFGTRRLCSSSLAGGGQPLRVIAISRPYLWLRRVLADGPPGLALRRLGVCAEHSAFRRGAWARLVGAALLGIGGGRAILAGTGRLTETGQSIVDRSPIQDTLLFPIALLLAGLLALIWGPRLVSTSRNSIVFRRLWGVAGTSSAELGRTVGDRQALWVPGLGAVLCAASGVLAGLTGRSGPLWLVAGVLVACIAVVLLWRPEAILLGVAAFPWLDWLARAALGDLGAAWDEGLLLLCIGLLVWGALFTGRLRPHTVPIFVPALCAFAAAVGSVVVRGVPGDVGLFALRVVFEPILFYFVAFLLFTTVRWARWAVGVFLASSVGLAVHGLYQFAARVPTPTRWVDASEGIVTRAFSVIGNPNGLGAVLLVGTLVALALVLSRDQRRSTRLVLAAAVVVQLGGIAVTFSRGAWIGLAFGLFALLMIAYRRYLLPAVVVGAVGLLAAPGVFVNRFLFLFSDTYVSKSAIDGRTSRWAAALDQMAAHPWFGVGLGTFGGSAADRFGYWATWVDNYFLQMGAEGGLLLLAAFVWLLVRVAKGLAKGYRVATDPFLRALAAGTFGAFVAVIVANMFASNFETLAVGAAFWFLAGLATSAALRSEAR